MKYENLYKKFIKNQLEDPEYTRQEVLGVLNLNYSIPGVKNAMYKACKLIEKEADYIY